MALTSADIALLKSLIAETVNEIVLGSSTEIVIANNSDMVDGMHAAEFSPAADVVTAPAANKILKLNNSGLLPASITGDADTVDGKHAADICLLANFNFSEALFFTPNANNPPTLKAGSTFLLDVTGYRGTVRVTADQTFTWSSPFPSISNSTIFYLHAEYYNGTVRFSASTTAPAKSDAKRGWYNANGRALLRFVVDGSGNVLPGTLCALTDNLVGELYTTTTGAPSISGLDIIKDGGRWEIQMRLIPDTGTAALFMRVNADATAANYYSSTDRLYAVASNINDACIVQNQIATLEAVINATIYFIGGRYMYSSSCFGLSTTYQLAAIGGDENDTAKRTNITSLEWSSSPGGWTAGSDIRIFRKRG